MKNIKIFLILSGFMTILAIWLSKYFFLSSFKMVKTEGVTMSSRNVIGQFSLAYDPLFILSIGLIPILIFVVMKITKIDSVKHLIIVAGIIVLSGLTFWQIRVQLIFAYLKQISKINNLSSEDVFLEYNIENLRFGAFFAFGILVGVILSLVYLKLTSGKRVQISEENP